MFGPELMSAFREFKSVWDPDNKMNPAQASSTPIRRRRTCGSARTTRRCEPPTHFTFPDDGGSLAKATLRCIGIGECRKHDAGTMCPSYMVTLEEEHSTRGRAHMLFEMLQGEVVRGGWKDEQVKQSLDLCLSCKACKSRVPDQRRHRDVPGGVPVALLRDAPAAAARLRVRHDRSLGEAGVDRAGAGERR